MRTLTLSLLLAARLAAPARAFPLKPALPEDFGPATIDVSGYPAEEQQTYTEVFVPFFTRFGGTPRMVNSPLVTPEEWKKEIERIRTRPACCSSCPYLTLKDARRLLKFMVYDSGVRKTGKNAAAWAALRGGLVADFGKHTTGGAR